MQKPEGEDKPDFTVVELAVLADLSQAHRREAVEFAVAVKQLFPGASVVALDVDEGV